MMPQIPYGAAVPFNYRKSQTTPQYSPKSVILRGAIEEVSGLPLDEIVRIRIGLSRSPPRRERQLSRAVMAEKKGFKSTVRLLGFDGLPLIVAWRAEAR